MGVEEGPTDRDQGSKVQPLFGTSAVQLTVVPRKWTPSPSAPGPAHSGGWPWQSVAVALTLALTLTLTLDVDTGMSTSLLYLHSA